MFLTAFLFLFLAAVIVFAVIVVTAFIGFWQTRVPYVRSSYEDTLQLLDKVSVTPDTKFYDLGSGDGRVVFLVEKLYGSRAVGYELTFWTHWQARLRQRLTRSSVQLHRKNFFKESWADADVIYCFLYPPLMRSIEEKFLADCKPGTVLVTRDFKLPTLQPIEELAFDELHSGYIYRK